MDWNLASIALTTGIVCLGALLQAVTGLGAGLIISPLLAIVSIELVPAPMIFGSIALSSMMSFNGRKHIDSAHFGLILGGILAGTVIAASYMAILPLDMLGLVFGVFILLAVLLSVRAPSFSLTPGGFAGAGVLSGVMGTSAGIGAPVLALLYQHHQGPSLRATLAVLYLASSITMLIFLHLAGRFGTNEFVSGLLLMPGFVLGYLVSLRLVRYIDSGYARPAVLTVSTVAACFLIGRSLLTLAA